MNQPDNLTLQATLDRTENRPEKKSSWSDILAWPGRVSLLIAIVLSPWAYGSVQDWSQKWIAIALLVGLGFWWFETALHRRKTQVLPYLFFPVAFGVVLALFQVVHLPDSIAGIFLERQVEIYDQFSGAPLEVITAEDGTEVVRSNAAKSISLDRSGTWLQIQMLFLAMAALLLGCRYFRTVRDMVLLLTTVFVNGIALTFFGLVQKLTSDGQSIYWTVGLAEGGFPFGPYVNKNNAAGYLLMCLACGLALAVLFMGKRITKGPEQMVSKELPFWRQFSFHLLYFIAELTATKIAILLGIVVINVGIISSLSRGGVIALMAGGIFTLLVYGMARKPKYTGFILLPIIVIAIALSSWVGLGDQLMKRFERVDTVNLKDDVRIRHWKDTWPAVSDMGPLGAGIGAYECVHRMYRQNLEYNVFAYAENQYFQTIVELGWPGLILLLFTWLLAFRCAALLIYRGSSPPTIAIGTLGVFMLSSLAIASVFDFGVYIPANTLLFASLCGLMSFHAHNLASRLKKKTLMRFYSPNFLVQAVLLIVFFGVTLAAIGLHRSSQLDATIAGIFKPSDVESYDLPDVDQAIEAVGENVLRSPTVKGLNAMGDLYVVRFRKECFENVIAGGTLDVLSGDRRQEAVERMWALTSPGRIHEITQFESSNGNRFEAQELLRKTNASYNLGRAKEFYAKSREMKPLQAEIQRSIGVINSLIGSNKTARQDLNRALKLAPKNPRTMRTSALVFMQSGDHERAADLYREYLTLKPRYFRKVMEVVKGKSGRMLSQMSDNIIVERMIPEDANLYYEFANKHAKPQSDVYYAALRKADLILSDVSPSEHEKMVLSADVKVKLAQFDDAIEKYLTALRSVPSDHATRYKVVELLLANGDLNRARKNSESLRSFASSRPKYQTLIDRVDKAWKNRDAGKQ